MVEFATKEIQMSLSKRLIIITFISFFSVSCVTSGGLRECGGTAALLGGIFGAVGVATGKNAGDRITRGLKGAAIGAALGGITCLLNRNDQDKIEEGLNTAPPQGTVIGSCLNEQGVKTRGFGVKPDECEKGALNVAIGKKIIKNGRECRKYSTEVLKDGEPKTEEAMACKGADGKWKDVT
jgi:surface antigen